MSLDRTQGRPQEERGQGRGPQDGRFGDNAFGIQDGGENGADGHEFRGENLGGNRSQASEASAGSRPMTPIVYQQGGHVTRSAGKLLRAMGDCTYAAHTALAEEANPERRREARHALRRSAGGDKLARAFYDEQREKDVLSFERQQTLHQESMPLYLGDHVIARDLQEGLQTLPYSTPESIEHTKCLTKSLALKSQVKNTLGNRDFHFLLDSVRKQGRGRLTADEIRTIVLANCSDKFRETVHGIFRSNDLEEAFEILLSQYCQDTSAYSKMHEYSTWKIDTKNLVESLTELYTASVLADQSLNRQERERDLYSKVVPQLPEKIQNRLTKLATQYQQLGKSHYIKWTTVLAFCAEYAAEEGPVKKPGRTVVGVHLVDTLQPRYDPNEDEDDFNARDTRYVPNHRGARHVNEVSFNQTDQNDQRFRDMESKLDHIARLVQQQQMPQSQQGNGQGKRNGNGNGNGNGTQPINSWQKVGRGNGQNQSSQGQPRQGNGQRRYISMNDPELKTAWGNLDQRVFPTMYREQVSRNATYRHKREIPLKGKSDFSTGALPYKRTPNGGYIPQGAPYDDQVLYEYAPGKVSLADRLLERASRVCYACGEPFCGLPEETRCIYAQTPDAYAPCMKCRQGFHLEKLCKAACPN
jgi:hypothetical protein